MKDWRELVSQDKGDSFNNSLLDDNSLMNYSNLNTEEINIKNNNTKIDNLKESIISNLKSIRKNKENKLSCNDSELINENNLSKLSSSTFRKSEKQKIEDYFKSKKNFYNQ